MPPGFQTATVTRFLEVLTKRHQALLSASAAQVSSRGTMNASMGENLKDIEELKKVWTDLSQKPATNTPRSTLERLQQRDKETWERMWTETKASNIHAAHLMLLPNSDLPPESDNEELWQGYRASLEQITSTMLAKTYSLTSTPPDDDND